MTPDIFLSYTREDQATAQRFAEAFEGQGFSVWWDAALRSGEAYDQVTEEALHGARAVVVLWSPRSVVSRWVRAEATVADQNKTLTPVMIEACRRPVMFELTQTADLSHWRGDPGDPAWLAFLGDVRRMFGKSVDAPSKAPQPAAPDSTNGGVPFVGVLPISHRAGDEGMDLLAEDLTEDITRELAQDSFFQVIAASTMAEWREGKINHKELGRELGAGYFIEGKLQRLGEDVRLTLQLIDVSTGGMLRSARHVRKLAEIGAQPEAFSRAVASEFSEAVTQVEAKRAMEKHGPCSGWDHVMRALALMERITPVTVPRAFEEAEQAVAQAPDLGLAHAVLARLVNLAVTLDRQALTQAHLRAIQDHIGRAVQLDGNNPAVLRFVVGAYANLGDGEAALRIARRVVELNPNSPHSYFALGQALHISGRYAEAIVAFREQLRLAPHDLNRPHGLMLLAVCLILAGEPDEAEEAFDRSLALHPNDGVALAFKAILQAEQGREAAARATAARVRTASEHWTTDQQLFIVRSLLRERAAEAEAVLCRLWGEVGQGA
jgi:TolB-like protein/Flp pilus assembly protein TadD